MISNLFLLFFAEKGMALLCLFHFFIFSEKSKGISF